MHVKLFPETDQEDQDNDILELGLVVHTCNHSVQEANEGGWTIGKNACYTSMRICVWDPSTNVNMLTCNASTVVAMKGDRKKWQIPCSMRGTISKE